MGDASVRPGPERYRRSHRAAHGSDGDDVFVVSPGEDRLEGDAGADRVLAVDRGAGAGAVAPAPGASPAQQPMWRIGSQIPPSRMMIPCPAAPGPCVGT